MNPDKRFHTCSIQNPNLVHKAPTLDEDGGAEPEEEPLKCQRVFSG